MSKNHDVAASGIELDRGTEEWPVHRAARTDAESVSLTVVEALASAKGVSPLEIEQPLYGSVDPEALDALFDPVDGAESSGRVVFTVDAYEVTVTASRDVYVRPTE